MLVENVAAETGSNLSKWDSEGIWAYAENPDMSPEFFITCGILLFTFFVLGSTCNGAVLVAFARHPELITPFQYFLVNLVISDFVMIAFGAPWDLLAISQFGWKLGKVPCFIVGFLKMFTGCASLLTLTVLSIQRCLFVWSPAYFSSHGFAVPKYCVVFVWILSASFSVPPFLGWSEYVPEQCGLSCAPCFADERYFGYSVYILVAGFVIPVIILVVASTCTILRMKYYYKLQKKLKYKKEIINRNEQKDTAMVLIMAFVFFLSWSGYSIICLLRIFGVTYPDASVAIAMMTAKSSAWTNSMIYVGMNSKLRRYVLPEWANSCCEEELEDKEQEVEVATIHSRAMDELEEDETSPKANQVGPASKTSHDDASEFTEDSHVCKQLEMTLILQMS